MMLLNIIIKIIEVINLKHEFIEISISYRNITHFKKLGYNAKLHESLKIKTIDLPAVSHQKVTAVCECCGKDRICYDCHWYKYH